MNTYQAFGPDDKQCVVEAESLYAAHLQAEALYNPKGLKKLHSVVYVVLIGPMQT